MVILVLLILTMALWFFSLFQYAPIAPYAEPARGWLAFFAVLLIVLWLFMPGLRGGAFG